METIKKVLAVVLTVPLVLFLGLLIVEAVFPEAFSPRRELVLVERKISVLPSAPSVRPADTASQQTPSDATSSAVAATEKEDEITPSVEDPCAPGSTWHVKQGDTLSGIAKMCWGTYASWRHLQAANSGINPYRLKAEEDHPGQGTILVIPEAPQPTKKFARQVVSASPRTHKKVEDTIVEPTVSHISAERKQEEEGVQPNVKPPEPTLPPLPEFDPDTSLDSNLNGLDWDAEDSELLSGQNDVPHKPPKALLERFRPYD